MTHSVLPLKDRLLNKVYAFAETIWTEKWTDGIDTEWIENFEGPDPDLTERERINMIYLLSKFMFFGQKEIRELLRSIYRDLYKYPVIEAIRKSHGDATDAHIINPKFQAALQETRFVGIGESSESGNHLLLFLRQETDLGKAYFINLSEISVRRTGDLTPLGKFLFWCQDHIIGRVKTLRLRTTSTSEIKRYVFIDDFCGSGSQASSYIASPVRRLKKKTSDVHASYFVLFGTQTGLERIRALGVFDSVEAVFAVDETFKAFSATSRYYDVFPDPTIEKDFAKTTAEKYGGRLFPAPLGWDDGQLLLGLSHNTPDNTLPIFWSDEGKWVPIFKRYTKKY